MPPRIVGATPQRISGCQPRSVTPTAVWKGGPTTLDDVEPFLYNLFNDPEIITLPSFVQWLNGPVAWLIAKGRAPSSREGYAAIGGGSPQLSTT